MHTLLRFGYPSLSVRCQLDSASSEGKQLTVGSPIVVIEAPPTLKTATPMPSLKINSGLVKEGDVGRIIARKPKDVWAVRLAIGAYLLDGKYFKPLDISE
ncbi:hypothetical protein ZIOFF_008052 [Zingiber officinale]|uniref:Chlororespiratory reduction 42 n=1 Tax=Zingiber officinale TaxID=94328 RepID=A0A8J5HY37_ZINOF|nr:hypothetical protein ZIOFF_008052 [Zingiber officinale]